MKNPTVPVLLVLALATAAAPARADGVSADPTTVASAPGPQSGPVVDTPAGLYAAVGCGLFGRALGSGLVNVGTIAGAIATCAYMFIDAVFFDR